MLPTARFRKVDGRTGVVRPGAIGVLAIVAAAATGPYNSAGSFTRDDLLQEAHGHGRLNEFGAYVLPETGKPIVAVAVDASTVGAYSAITTTNPGTSVITAGATEPVDTFDVFVDFPTGGTIGVAGITYRYSLDGGKTMSKALALGIATAIVIPDTGITLELAAGTILATTTAELTTTAPKLTNADLPDALEALRITSLPFDCILIDMEADATTVGICDLWLKDLATAGKFKQVLLNARPQGPAETATQYRDALALIVNAAASTDVIVFADGSDLVSPVRGISLERPTSLSVAARIEQISVGTDPAYVELGPLAGVRITDDRGEPKYHDEQLFPGLDDIRLSTLRTIPGYEGVYPTNVNVLSPTGSDFVYIQHTRCANRGAEIAYQIFTKKLSKGVRKNPTPGPNGERYIHEAEAQQLEELGNAQIYLELVATAQVDDMRVIVSRVDDIQSNAGAKVRGAIEIVSLGYVKEFDFTIGFVTQITAPTAGT